MNPQDNQGGSGPMRGAETQPPQGAGGVPGGHAGMHGGYGYGYAPAMAAPPWGAHMAPWQGPHPYPYAHPYGLGFAAGWGPGPAGWGPGPGWAPTGAAQASAPGTQALGLLNNRFVMGMLVGGALTYVLTNEAFQRAAIRGIMQVWLNIQGGIEETKERFRDAESEIKTGRQG
ncbi:MAG: hypothetical protein ACXW3T_01495 [Rhodoplanes sp.]